jgi:glycosyltransferase involved in cell wall biosynthesis
MVSKRNAPLADSSISVILPALNRHDLIAEAVRSAHEELDASDEIVIVDDASTPPIALEMLEAVRPAVRLVRSEVNRGPAGARNLGLAHARGSLIAFLDSDDCWLPGKITAQRRMLAATNKRVITIGCGWREMDTKHFLSERFPRPSLERGDFFAGCWFAPGSTLLAPASVFHQIGGFDERLRRLEDYEWFMRFALAGGQLLVADMLGVQLARGYNAAPQNVEAAAALITAKIAAMPQLKADERRNALSYLDLERARAFANAGIWSKTAWALGRSFLRCPRRRLALRPWWTTDGTHVQ